MQAFPFRSILPMARKTLNDASPRAPRATRRGQGRGFSLEIETVEADDLSQAAPKWSGTWLLA